MRARVVVPTFHIQSKKDFETHVTHPQGSIIGFFDSTQGDPGKCAGHEEANPETYAFKKAYMKIVQSLIEDFRFGHITDRKLAKEIFGTEDVPEGPWNSILYHKNMRWLNKFEADYEYFDLGQLTAGKIKKWIGGIGNGKVPVVNQGIIFYSHCPV